MMMTVFRICRRKWADSLTGEGARIFGGRWNEISTACIYTSASRALAILEFTVNTNIDDIPRSLSIVEIEIPDEIHQISIDSLPGDWKDSPAPRSTKRFGSKILRAAKYPVLCFPSAIIPSEYNYILNPLHPLSKKFRILQISDLIYDLRIKQK
jgi:RES domain-containing protein